MAEFYAYYFTVTQDHLEVPGNPPRFPEIPGEIPRKFPTRHPHPPTHPPILNNLPIRPRSPSTVNFKLIFSRWRCTCRRSMQCRKIPHPLHILYVCIHGFILHSINVQHTYWFLLTKATPCHLYSPDFYKLICIRICIRAYAIRKLVLCIVDECGNVGHKILYTKWNLSLVFGIQMGHAY